MRNAVVVTNVLLRRHSVEVGLLNGAFLAIFFVMGRTTAAMDRTNLFVENVPGITVVTGELAPSWKETGAQNVSVYLEHQEYDVTSGTSQPPKR